MNKKFKQILLIILMSSMVLSSGGFLDLITLGGTVYASGGDKAAAAIEEESSGSSVQEESASGDAKGSDTSADKAGDNSGASESDTSKSSGEQSSDQSGKADGSEKSDKADAKSDDAAQGNADKANADGTKAQDSKAAKDKAADKDSTNKNKDKIKLKYQKLKVTSVQAPLYKTDSKDKKASAEVKRVRRFWKSLTGRKIKAEDNNKTGSKSPVKLVIAGDLPKGATAEATYIEYDEKDIYNEQILTAFDITIRDKDGKVYIPETPVSITVKGRAVESATDEGAAVLIYSCVPDKERTASYKEKYGIKYAADVLVYRDGTGDDARREYKVYKKNKTYKDGKDAVRYREDKAGLSYDDESTIVFDYTYGKNTGKQAKAKDTAGTLHFVMSQQLPQEVIDANLEAKEAAEADADAAKAASEDTPDENAEEIADDSAKEGSADKEAVKESADPENVYDDAAKDGWIVDDLEEDDDAETAETTEAADAEKSGSGSDKAAAENAEKAKDGEDKADAADKDTETADTKDAKAEAGTEAGEKEDGKDKNEEKAAESGAVSEDPASSAKTKKVERTATDGKTYRVTATYDTDSGIPDNAELVVKEIRQGEFGYKSYVNRSAEEIGKEPDELGFVKLLDISFRDPITGLEYQPDDKVIVNIELLKNDVSESSDVDVVHFGDKKVEVMDSEVKDGAVEFEAEGFSVYVVMGYDDTTGNAGVGIQEDSAEPESEQDVTETEPLTREYIGQDGSWAYWKLTLNPQGRELGDRGNLTLSDTFDDGYELDARQTIDYASIKVKNSDGTDATGVKYDYSGNTGTFVVTDETAVIITYRTRIKADPGDAMYFRGTATLKNSQGDTLATSTAGAIDQQVVIYPSASDVAGLGNNYKVRMYVYGEGNMQTGIPGAQFILLDANQRALEYKVGDNKGQPVTFTTGDDGYVDIELDEEDGDIAINKNTGYYLEMIKSVDGYQKDNTLYSFMITDDPDYSSGGFYKYYNGDTMKVRLYPASPGLSVSIRFSGSYSLTEEQQNNVTAVLQKWDGKNWVEVERHPYSDSRWGGD